MSSPGILDSITVLSPCSALLDSMPGDERVRFCLDCGQNVYNLSAMSRAEAEAFVSAKEGPGCIRFYRRQDGSIQTRDCPRASEMAIRATRRLAARLLAFALLLIGLVPLLASRASDPSSPGTGLRTVEPFKTVVDWLEPPVSATAGAPVIPLRTMTAGKPCLPRNTPADPQPDQPEEP